MDENLAKLIKIKPSDSYKIERFCELSTVLFKEYYSSLIPSDALFNILLFLDEETIKKEIKQKIWQYYLIEYNEKYIGVLILEKEQEFLRISNIFILKKLRKKGIGRNILKQLIEIAKEKNINKLKIGINKNDKRASHIFSKLGFNCTNLVARFIANGTYAHENIFIKEIQ